MKKVTIDDNQPASENINQEAAIDSAPSNNAPEPETNKASTDASDAKVAELTQDLQRTRADFENYRKQVDLQRTQAMSVAKYATVEKFLPLIDDFERALNSYPEQLAPLAKTFEKTLSSIGLEKIDSNPGTEFNPSFHDAISVEDGDGDFEVIAETLRPGYLYDQGVVRSAMVRVKRISK